MAWDFKHAGDIERLTMLQETKGIISEALESRPEVEPTGLFYWDAFHAISSDRQMSMSVGPIGFTVMDSFARRYNLVDQEFEDFVYVMRELDKVFLSHVNKDAKKRQTED